MKKLDKKIKSLLKNNYVTRTACILIAAAGVFALTPQKETEALQITYTQLYPNVYQMRALNDTPGTKANGLTLDFSSISSTYVADNINTSLLGLSSGGIMSWKFTGSTGSTLMFAPETGSEQMQYLEDTVFNITYYNASSLTASGNATGGVQTGAGTFTDTFTAPAVP